MTSKYRVVLIADEKKQCRDDKLGRFVRDAEENPLFRFVKWKQQDQSRWLAIQNDRLCEVQRINDNRSIFAPGNIVMQDGSILLLTPIDPLYLLLGQLASWQRNTQFCMLHDVMESTQINLSSIIRWNSSSIERICDVEEPEDMDTIRIRRNDIKIIEWLRLKTDRIVKAMAKTKTIEQLAFTSSFERPPESKPADLTTNDESDKKEQTLQTAILLLTEYVDKVWIDLLVKSYGLSATDWDKEKHEKVKTGGDLIAKYDARLSTSVTPAKRPASTQSKTTTAAKKKPVNTSGMKSISSFFGKK